MSVPPTVLQKHDTAPLFLLQMDFHTLRVCSETCKSWKTILKTSSFWAQWDMERHKPAVDTAAELLYCQTILSMCPEEPSCLLAMAIRSQEANDGNLESWLDRIKAATQPDQLQALLARSLIEEREGMEFALDTIESAVRLYPNHPKPRIFLGYAYADLGRIEDALEQFQTVGEIAPKDYTLARALAHHNMACSLSDPKLALVQLDHSLKIAPNYLRPRLRLAKLLRQANRFGEARQALRFITTGEAFSPVSKCEAHLDLARLRQSSRKSIRDCSRAIEANPCSHYAWRLKVAYLVDSGEVEEGFRVLDEAIAYAENHCPENIESYNAMREDLQGIT